MADFKDNHIEWLVGSERITLSLTDRKMISKVKKLVEELSGLEADIHINRDGSILAHLPLSTLKFHAPRKLDENAKKALSERGKALASSRHNKEYRQNE